jgi:hypothetical protein
MYSRSFWPNIDTGQGCSADGPLGAAGFADA